MPATPEISKLVVDAAIAQLSHSTNGFNARMATISAARNLKTVSFDFTGVSGNFLQMQPQILDHSLA